MEWFEVDRKGLAKILERRGKAFALFELVQNSWDTGAKRIDVTLEKIPGRPAATLVVEDDDPDGFADLAHSYTLFAESEKKGDPTKRGRFNLGEKLVLALCKRAEITSTTGTVIFDMDGQRRRSQRSSNSGSRFWAEIRMNTQEFNEACFDMLKLIPPEGSETVFNGTVLKRPRQAGTFTETLQTVRSDEEGNLKRTQRKCRVAVYEADGAAGWIYELGIPVVETGDLFHVDVQQKVPVNLDRDNVPPAYLRKLRAMVLNATHNKIRPDQMQETWVAQALEDPGVKGAAVKDVVVKRFGDDRAIFDMNDREANMRITGRGGTVIPPRTFSATAWDNIRRHKAALPSGKIAPSPAVKSGEGDPVPEVPEDEWTPEIRAAVSMILSIGQEIIDPQVQVKIAKPGNDPNLRKFMAWYRAGTLTLNISYLGKKWFRATNRVEIIRVAIHEYAHHYSGNHLDDSYQHSIQRIGANIVDLALREPGLFVRVPS